MFSVPRGSPIETTKSPTRRLSELPNSIALSPDADTIITATLVVASLPITLPSTSRPSDKITLRLLAPRTALSLAKIKPNSASTTTPLVKTSRLRLALRRESKKRRKNGSSKGSRRADARGCTAILTIDAWTFSTISARDGSVCPSTSVGNAARTLVVCPRPIIDQSKTRLNTLIFCTVLISVFLYFLIIYLNSQHRLAHDRWVRVY